jgi:hypothetical protein
MVMVAPHDEAEQRRASSIRVVHNTRRNSPLFDAKRPAVIRADDATIINVPSREWSFAMGQRSVLAAIEPSAARQSTNEQTTTDSTFEHAANVLCSLESEPDQGWTGLTSQHVTGCSHADIGDE